MLHKNISVAVKIVALKSVATLHFHVVFLFCDRFHWRRSFSFWCITSWSLTRIVNGIIIRSTWGCYTWYKWQLSRWGLKILFNNFIRVWAILYGRNEHEFRHDIFRASDTNRRAGQIQFALCYYKNIILGTYMTGRRIANF